MNKQTIITQVILLAILVIAITFLIVSYEEENDLGIKNILGLENEIRTSLGISTYKYNTLCDIKFISEEYPTLFFITFMEMRGGMHNNNEHLIEFFKTDKFMSMMDLTPDMIFGIEDKREEGSVLARNYDPIFYDGGYWAVPIWHIMGINPEIVDLLTSMRDGSSPLYISLEIQSELEKCQ